MSDTKQVLREAFGLPPDAPNPATGPGPGGNPSNEPTDHELVTCVLGGVEFGINIGAVQEIVRLPKITPVPRAPGYVEGVANLRGNVLPIVNSRARFGLPPGGGPDTDRVVVVELNGAPTGLIVDAVREVMHVKAEDVEPAPLAVQSVDGRFLKGVVKLSGGRRLVLLLDHNALLEPAPGAQASGPDPTDGPGASSGHRVSARTAEEHEHLVTFRLGEEEYGVPIMDVQEIIRVPPISTIPNAPPGVVGIASLRNRILPVVDLRTKFGFRPLKAELESFCARVKEFEGRHSQAVERLREAAAHGTGFDREHLAADRAFARWQEGFASSDRLLLSLLVPVREAFKEAAAQKRLAADQIDARNFAAAREHVDGTLRAAHARLLGALDKLYTGIARRDDERCLVVSVGGTALALRVDAVNQVLVAPRSTVEATPAIVTGKGSGQDQLRGIAKLDGGKRLVMLLAVDRLVTRTELTAVTQLSDPAAARGEARIGADSDERQLVTFKVANEEFAVDIMQVQEIVRLGKVTKVPHVPEFVEGVVNLRGAVLPVIDLRKRVHLAHKEYSDATRVVVMDLGGVKTGIIVDAVSEVMRVRAESIEPAPAVVRSRYGDHIVEGVGKLNKGDRMFLLLRADELLRVSDPPAVSA